MGELEKEWPGRVVCLAAPGHWEIYCSEIVAFVLVLIWFFFFFPCHSIWFNSVALISKLSDANSVCRPSWVAPDALKQNRNEKIILKWSSGQARQQNN